MSVWAVLGLLSFWAPEPAGFAGYVEGQYRYIGAVSAGRITAISAEEGAEVAADAPLFALDDAAAKAALQAATARADLAQVTFERTKALPASVASRAQVDADRAALDAALAERAAAQTALSERAVTAPLAGQVGEVYYEQGEVVAAGAPVLSILPPEALEVIFYLPQAARGAMQLGQTLALSCEGCRAGLTATLTHLDENAQYTPPIIYSREERDRLVWRAKAKVAAGSGLLVGQPVMVQP